MGKTPTEVQGFVRQGELLESEIRIESPGPQVQRMHVQVNPGGSARGKGIEHEPDHSTPISPALCPREQVDVQVGWKGPTGFGEKPNGTSEPVALCRLQR